MVSKWELSELHTSILFMLIWNTVFVTGWPSSTVCVQFDVHQVLWGW